MSAFLAQLGKSLAERWLALLVLPGLLWIATAVAAYHVGQARPWDLRPMMSWLDHISGVGVHRLSTEILAAAIALLAAAAAGLAASGLGTMLQRMWTAPAINPPLAWILQARRKRWKQLREAARQKIARAHDPELTGKSLIRSEAAARRAQRRRLAGPSQLPQRPTRIAERFNTSTIRARTLYGLDLDLAWPRLWTVLPETQRADITAARDAYTAASRLTAWALMYAALGSMWWPAALLGTAIFATATSRARDAADLLADLIDTATDLHLTALTDQLHIATTTPPSPDTGIAITQRLTRPHDPKSP